ncbi:UNC93-like protein [Schistocerca nitens]|uniref:UNC93-like protein n=1 Tax=Schistocerca nitens TaxID=7011 RepID=UPI00211916B9|nr:UNC93-like protein [Schistocerca nitens]
MESVTLAACGAPEGIRTEVLLQATAADPGNEELGVATSVHGPSNEVTAESGEDLTPETIRAAEERLDKLSLRSVSLPAAPVLVFSIDGPIKRFVEIPDDSPPRKSGRQDNGGDREPLNLKMWMVKNMAALGLAFMVHYIAMKGANNLQSSVNAEGGLGTSALTAYYSAFIFSNAFLPVIIIRWLGCKWTMAAGILGYVPYMAAQFWPSFWTLVPGALLAGLSAGPLWCAQSTYLSHVTGHYADATPPAPGRRDALMVRSFGAFYMLYQMSQVWGNLISSAVLSLDDHAIEAVAPTTPASPTPRWSGAAAWPRSPPNATQPKEVCGARFCPLASRGPEAHGPPLEVSGIFVITAIFIGCIVAASATVALFVDAIDRKKQNDKGSSGVKLLVTTMKLLKNRKQLLLLPITMWLGVQDAFVSAEYTSAYVTCGWGIQNIGYVMICFGVTNSASALLLGWAVKITGRLPIMVASFALHVAILATLLIWYPHPTNHTVYFVIAGLWGITDGVWQAQVNALYGLTFPGKEEAAYSSFRLFESLGYIIAYSYSAWLCTYIKIYSVLGLLILGFAGYLVIEIGVIHKQKSSCK